MVFLAQRLMLIFVSDQRQKSDHENVTLPLLELMEEIVDKEFLPPATCLVSQCRIFIRFIRAKLLPMFSSEPGSILDFKRKLYFLG